MKKKVLLLCLLIFSLFTSQAIVKAEDYNKDGYIYSYWGEAIPSAFGMSAIQTYDQFSLNVKLDTPQDIFSYNNQLYIVDSTNNSLIVLNDKFEVVEVKEEFTDIASDSLTTLNQPSGIAVTKDAIYIADTQNHRILKLNHNYDVITSFGTPNEQTFDEGKLEFSPLKVAVDKTDRIYVIARDVYEGIIELNSDGTFNRFTGVNPISVSFFDALWRKFATEEQLKQMKLYLPTSFTNMIIDDSGFIYSTSKADKSGNSNNMIKKINPKGIDVLRKNGYQVPKGDVIYAKVDKTVVSGPSELVDIAINDIGMYTVLDQKRGRLFTYDEEGRLLYISADKGVQEGMLSTPVALTYFNNNLVVLDQKNKSLEVYGLTEFGELVNKAVRYHKDGEFDEAAKVWKEVAELNTNYEIAYVGIGKSLLKQRDYKAALDNFKLGKDKYYYAKAFEGYRKDLINKNFSLIMTVLTVGAVFIFRKPLIEIFTGDREDEQ